MKARYLIMVAVILITASLAFINGCEYDVTEPLWEKPYTEPPTPRINQVNPQSEAKPGVNTITISGENFVVGSDTTLVYFDNVPADVISMSATSIKVRRPNLALDSSTIKIVPNRAFLVAKYSPYKIYHVTSAYGSFLDNLALGAVAVDNSENLYVVETASKYVYKVTPSGDKTIIGTASRGATDANFGPDGNLYLMGSNRAMDKVDLTSGTIARWTQMPAGKVIRFGDFDANGYFYCGGTRTDICILSPNPPATLSNSNIKLSGKYATQEILAVRVYNGYLYVVSRTGTQPAVIWKHSIGAEGTLGDQEQVFDMATAGEYSSLSIRGITFSPNGKLFIASDSASPLLTVDLASSQVDVFYKGILRPYCKQFSWGNNNYLYMIVGDDNAPEVWTVYRVDMGE